jgi:16S rRNA (cytidine1402-2'-O)-methyltransferase
MGDCDPMDVLPQTNKRSIDLIDSYLRTTRQLGNQSKLLIQKKTSRFKTVYFKQAYRDQRTILLNPVVEKHGVNEQKQVVQELLILVL